MKKLVLLAVLFGLTMIIGGCGEKMVSNPGLTDGRLASCPSSPNCVSSMEEGDQYITPLAFSGDDPAALLKMKKVLPELPGMEIQQESGDYLWVTFSSKVFGFVDDLEIYIPAGEKQIHFRSAARTGYYDFGVNRKRIEKIRAEFEKML